MDFKGQNKFDYNDINNFLPDNFTTGTAEFYQNKFGNKFPDHYYKLMEILARPEYNDPEELTHMVDQIRIEAREENEKLINEWNERQSVVHDFVEPGDATEDESNTKE